VRYFPVVNGTKNNRNSAKRCCFKQPKTGK
jgi:hypothetical protein